MNISIAYLPEEVQEKLSRLVDCIINEVPETQYVILYGSYARGDYVDYDQQVEYGLRTCYQSDFDIVVLTPKKKAAQNSISRRLDNASAKYARGYADPKVPPVEFLVEYVEDFNERINEGQYFYTDIVKEGVVLYNSGNYEIEPVRELNYAQILNLSKKYYNKRYNRGNFFLKMAKFGYDDGDYEGASFLLHQAAENLLLSIILTASLYSKKTHDLKKMLQKTKLFTSDAIDVFQIDTVDGKRLLDLLNNAYVQARYNDDFKVSKDDIEKLIEILEHLRAVIEKFCLDTISEHEKRAIQ